MKLKEVKFRPVTGQHDIEHKMKKVIEFLEGGDRVRLTVTFTGRELAHKDLGKKLLLSLLSMCPVDIHACPIKDESRSVSMDLMVRRH
jgi:translation initiation factor IF-3